jgi:hypothetical protein
VFIDPHEAFFYYFIEFLQMWILRLKDNHPTNQIIPIEWTTDNIVCLERVNNKFANIVDFWIDNIILGFINEFVVRYCMKSYTFAEKYFLKGSREGIFDHSIR